MSTLKWTPEPLNSEGRCIFDATGRTIAIAEINDKLAESIANTERLAACWNGCLSIRNPAAVADAVEALKRLAKHGFNTPEKNSDVFDYEVACRESISALAALRRDP